MAILLCAAALVAALVALGACDGSTPAMEDSKAGVIRLHILANSDSAADQEIKLKVRDFLLEKWGKRLESFGSEDGAWSGLGALVPEIQSDVGALLKGYSASYGAEVETGVYRFPEKDYNGVVFPGGDYRALKVSLGSGRGHNWWCVMFPPLCLVSDGEMDMEQYTALVKKLDAEGALAAGETAPPAPVRSWLFDKVVGGGQWDEEFFAWAKKYWIGGDGK